MEAVTMVGGAILAPLFESSLDLLKSNNMFTYARGSKVLEEVNEWKATLEAILAVLVDAENQRRTDGVVNSWFNDLRDLAYDVDDVVDELITHAAQRKFRAQTETGVEKLLRCGMSFSCVKFSVGMDSKVKDVSRRLEGIKKRMELQNNALGRNMRVNEEITARPPATSLVEPKVRGREEDYKAIVDMMKTGGGDGGISVICIVGMGGVGKTTLAQMLYNDNSFQFDFKAWVSVGEDFDLVTTTKTIVPSEGDLNSAQTKLREELSGKKFLMVLDDLWSEDYDKWIRFYIPFASGAPGSRIIITTRSNKVSSTTSTAPLSYHLEILSNDDCLSLLAHHALGKEDFSKHKNLMEVGEEIVKKCKGLPLAVKALGGLLRGKPSLNDWKILLEDKLWEEKNTILPALRLSYYNLPPPLKRCFAYCAIFPKEYEFDRDDLVLLWLAEGFLPNLSKGYAYFDDLFARSLFQKSVKDTSRFLMHDLINDLARYASGGVCLNLDEQKWSEELCAHVRHLAYNRGRYDIATRFEFFQHTKSLRTILALPIFEEWNIWDEFYISSKILDVWIPKLKCLRVLSLSGYKRVEFSKSLSTLQHLRYLNLCGSEIETLPVFITKLFNLQVLILRNCKELRELPEDFCNMINLQCIDLRGTKRLEKMPLHIGNLEKLHILSKFIVGNTDGSGIQELLKIPNLQGHVCVTELQNVVSRDCWRMKEKEKIEELVLEWNGDFDPSRDEENEKQVLEALQPQKNVGRMSIKSYGGREFPSWFGNESFKMTVVKIHNCRNVSSLPPLGGLPSLKELSIEGMPGVMQVGVEFYGVVSSSSCSNVFPSLEILNFEDMENWKVWCCFEDVEYKGHIFPKLKKLGIRSCSELVGDLPKSLHSLEELVIGRCKAEVLKGMSKLESLTKLEISYISGLASFNVAFPETFKSLEELLVVGCPGLEHLWENGIKAESLGSLKYLEIQNCAKLVSVVGEEDTLPPNLQLLGIHWCENLERLPNELNNLKSLTTMWISGCPKLTTIGDMPENLKMVKIEGDSLVRFGEGIMVDENGKSYNGQTSRIENLTLEIAKSESLIVPSNVVLPTSLKHLRINGGVETQFLRSLELQNQLSHLTSLSLYGCLLESFPATGLPIPTLLYLTLWKCKNLRSLPYNFHSLTSLTTLYLIGCPKVECFPERGMPPNLSILTIHYCDTLERQPLSEWRLDRLPLLEFNIIGDMEMVSSFPHHSLPLPTSLTYLTIHGFQNLKSISSGLQTLTSVQMLIFFGCPKLQYLPKEGLPPSLGKLSFWNCPLMEKQCKTKYRSHLAHIPCLDTE